MSEKKLKWIDWPHDECPICGASVQIETACQQDLTDDLATIDGEPIPPPYCYSEDAWRCSKGHHGKTYAESDMPVQLEGGDDDEVGMGNFI